MVVGYLTTVMVGIMQGIFVFPFTKAGRWKWEHYWFVFAIFGMILFNVVLSFLFVPGIATIVSNTDKSVLIKLIITGLVWGAGSIMFGRGMEMLGFTLGYPVIMGTTVSFGTLIPALINQPWLFTQARGILLVAGCIVSIAGIILCARASKARVSGNNAAEIENKRLIQGIIVGVLAGILCSAPSWVSTIGGEIKSDALEFGTDPHYTDCVIWLVLFTAGAVTNAVYCTWVMKKNNNLGELVKGNVLRNFSLVALGSLIWICSLYMYGISASYMGSTGLIIGWGIMIVISVVTGNVIGLIRGEWKGAPPRALRLLVTGLVTLLISVIIIIAIKF